MVKIKIGDKVIFDPVAEVWIPGCEEHREEVIGEVIEINEDHNWFRVKYKLGDETLWITFNFIDLVEGHYARRVKIVRD